MALSIAALSWLQFRYRLLQYLFFLRVPVVHAVVLLLLPLAVWSRAFGTLFVLTLFQLAAVAFLLLLTTWAVINASGVVFVAAAPRFKLKFLQPDFRNVVGWDADPAPNRLMGMLASDRVRAYAVPLVLGAPILGVCAWQSTSPWWAEAFAIAGGVAAAFGLREVSVWAGRQARQWLYRSQPALPAARFLNLRNLIREAAYRFGDTAVGRAFTSAFSNGYSNLSSDDPATTGTPLQETESSFSHWKTIALIALTLAIYVLGAFVLNPARTNIFAVHTPALAYVLLVATLLGLALTAITFFADLYRVPLILFLMIALALSYRFSDLDHYYDFATPENASTPLGSPLPAQEVMARWAEKHSSDKFPVMVVITTSGGGSHAARWTTQVLYELSRQQQLGERFFQSTAFVSAVSGGALGMMYALEGFRSGAPSQEGLKRAIDSASHSNVGALAWGMAYPDLVRKVVPRLFDPRHDRGWALEQAWQSVLTDPARRNTLAAWAEDARNGHKPAVVFNATEMETGRRFLISRIDIPRTAADQFARRYKDRDLSVITAVRLSAAFPFLSPMARPLSPYRPTDQEFPLFEQTAYHLGDGGYYDSSGTLTALEFLTSVLPEARKLGRTRVLLVEIRTALEPGETVGAGHQNWLAGLLGPLSTSYHASTSSQGDRAAFERQLLVDRWNNADLPGDARIQIQPVTFRLRDSGTLPWHLSEDEQRRISEAWGSEENQRALTTLTDFFVASR